MDERNAAPKTWEFKLLKDPVKVRSTIQIVRTFVVISPESIPMAYYIKIFSVNAQYGTLTCSIIPLLIGKQI
jgi:hypothetical protein